jgi:nitrate/nitrite transporter NarK
MDFLPFLALSLWGGYIADRFNRQRILQISFSFAIPLSIALWISFDLFHTQTISANLLLIHLEYFIFIWLYSRHL